MTGPSEHAYGVLGVRGIASDWWDGCKWAARSVPIVRDLADAFLIPGSRAWQQLTSGQLRDASLRSS